MTGESSVMPEDCVFDDRLSTAHRLKEIPQMRLHLVPGNTAVSNTFWGGFAPGRRIVLFVPFFEVFLAQRLGEAERIITGREVHARLRSKSRGEFAQLEKAFGSHKAVNFWTFGSQVELHVNWKIAVLEQRCMHIGHVPAVFP